MPTRYLKPGIRDSALIDQLSPMSECLFYRLLVTVDDFGRYDARPALIKAHCFPVKESVTVKKCEELLNELASCGLLVLYSVDGKSLLQLEKWDNKARAVESKFPPMPTDADKRIHLSADVNDPPTNLPVTVTGTVTKAETGTRAAPDGVSPSVWKDFQELRKRLKAPITQTALDGIAREAAKKRLSLEDALRMCCERSWRGFKADWVPDSELPKSNEPDPVLEKLKHDAEKAIPIPENIKAKLGSLVEHLRMQ